MTLKQSKISKIVVADTTPLIVLGNSGYLFLLKALFERIYIPKAVFNEVVVKMDKAAKEIINSEDWVSVCKLNNEISNYKFNVTLDSGEKEAIALALDLKADLILLDETKARKEAKYQNLTAIGTLGIIVLAKNRGIIKEVKPILDILKENGMFLSNEIIEKVLIEVKEND